MNRVEKFRKIRIQRRKYFSSFFLFLVILWAGAFVADYSGGMLMGNETRSGIVAFTNTGSYLEISVLNEKVFINTERLSKDLSNMKKFFSGLAP